MAPRTPDRPRAPRRGALALLLSLLLPLGLLAGQVHHLVEAHEVCEAHGDLVHAEHAHEGEHANGDGLGPDHPLQPRLRAERAASRAALHEHCPLADLARERPLALLLGSPTPAQHSFAVSAPDAHYPFEFGAPLFLLAPKHSPPV